MKKIILASGFLLIFQFVYAQDSVKISYENLKLLPVLWQQDAAEYRALCYQAFNIATLRLNEIQRKKFRRQKLAVITDLDETILDNSYAQAQLIKEGRQMSGKEWLKWTSQSAATPVPGAVAFLNYAKQKGASIFYISNRSVGDVQVTLINLQKLQLPDADTSHMLFLSTTASKEARRQAVMNNYNVVMLLGDNLNDFTQAFEVKKMENRFAETDSIKENWGKKFIVLPNATYGEWENALVNYTSGLSSEERIAALKALLKGYAVEK